MGNAFKDVYLLKEESTLCDERLYAMYIYRVEIFDSFSYASNSEE